MSLKSFEVTHCTEEAFAAAREIGQDVAVTYTRVKAANVEDAKAAFNESARGHLLHIEATPTGRPPRKPETQWVPAKRVRKKKVSVPPPSQKSEDESILADATEEAEIDTPDPMQEERTVDEPAEISEDQVYLDTSLGEPAFILVDGLIVESVDHAPQAKLSEAAATDEELGDSSAEVSATPVYDNLMIVEEAIVKLKAQLAAFQAQLQVVESVASNTFEQAIEARESADQWRDDLNLRTRGVLHLVNSPLSAHPIAADIEFILAETENGLDIEEQIYKEGVALVNKGRQLASKIQEEIDEANETLDALYLLREDFGGAEEPCDCPECEEDEVADLSEEPKLERRFDLFINPFWVLVVILTVTSLFLEFTVGFNPNYWGTSFYGLSVAYLLLATGIGTFVKKAAKGTNFFLWRLLCVSVVTLILLGLGVFGANPNFTKGFAVFLAAFIAFDGIIPLFFSPSTPDVKSSPDA